jgi:hypothetical protein
LWRSAERGATRVAIDSKVLAFLDQAIATLENDLVVETAGLSLIDVPEPAASTEFSGRNSIF